MLQNKSRGFTLIELLVVISIISLLSSIVLASLSTARDRGRIAASQQFEGSLHRAAGDMAVAMWDFNECSGSSVADLPGVGNNGTLISTVAASWSRDTPSGQGCSISLNGSTQYMTAPGINFPVGTNTYSISAWIKPTSMGSFGIIGWGNYVSNNATALRLGWGEIRHYWFNNDLAHPISLSDGKWHHVAVVYDGTTRSLYINGVFIRRDTPSTSGRTFTTNNNVTVGRTFTNEYFPGLLDNVRVYAKSLTAMEVENMYAEAAKNLALN